MSPAAFLDRDGVINKEKGHFHKIDDFEWINGSIEAIKYLNNKNYYVFVVTNQSGIARGYFDEKDVELLHSQINLGLNKHHANIDEFFYSPYHPDFNNKYQNLSNLRKPNTGMLDKAYEKYKFDKSKSFMIGDQKSDMLCAKNFGIQGFLFNSGNLFDFIKSIDFFD